MLKKTGAVTNLTPAIVLSPAYLLHHILESIYTPDPIGAAGA
jgi:hypothetical protein